MKKIFKIFFVKKNSKSFEKKNSYHGKKTPIMVTGLTGIYSENVLGAAPDQNIEWHPNGGRLLYLLNTNVPKITNRQVFFKKKLVVTLGFYVGNVFRIPPFNESVHRCFSGWGLPFSLLWKEQQQKTIFHASGFKLYLRFWLAQGNYFYDAVDIQISNR